MRLVYLTTLILLISASAVFAGEVSQALMFPEEYKEIIYIDKRNSEPRASVTLNIEQFDDGKRLTYRLSQEGEGNWDEYDNIRWSKTANLLEKDGMIYTLESTTKIKSRNDFVLAEMRKFYDYNSKMVTFQKLNANGKVLYEKDFPIKGPICDYITMPHFLKIFAKHHGEKAYRDFYLLSNEPKMYHVRIKDRQEGTLKLPMGEVESVKLQLMADLGPLTETAAMFLPKTYIWYASEHPHYWLQYQGLDSNPSSAHVRAYISKREPAIHGLFK